MFKDKQIIHKTTQIKNLNSVYVKKNVWGNRPLGALYFRSQG